MHTCISSHGLKRSWRSCPRRVNAGNKNTPSTHHPRRRNVTTLMVGLKKATYAKISPKSGEPQRYSWGTQKKKEKKKEKKKAYVIWTDVEQMTYRPLPIPHSRLLSQTMVAPYSSVCSALSSVSCSIAGSALRRAVGGSDFLPSS